MLRKFRVSDPDSEERLGGKMFIDATNHVVSPQVEKDRMEDLGGIQRDKELNEENLLFALGKCVPPNVHTDQQSPYSYRSLRLRQIIARVRFYPSSTVSIPVQRFYLTPLHHRLPKNRS